MIGSVSGRLRKGWVWRCLTKDSRKGGSRGRLVDVDGKWEGVGGRGK